MATRKNVEEALRYIRECIASNSVNAVFFFHMATIEKALEYLIENGEEASLN